MSVADPSHTIDEISGFTDASPRKSTTVHINVDARTITTPGNAPPVAVKKPLANLPRLKVASLAKPQEKKPLAKAKSKGKKTRELITPVEYAKKLHAQYTANADTEDGVDNHKLTPRAQYLADFKIFFVGGDSMYASEATRNKMSIVGPLLSCSLVHVVILAQIYQRGGTVCSTFDPAEVTHIVTDADARVTLRALGLKRLSDIPEHIPTVKWSWVNSAKWVQDKDQGRRIEMGWTVLHAAFASRLDAGSTILPKKADSKGKEKERADSDVQLLDAAPGGSASPSHAPGPSSTSPLRPRHSDRTDDPLSRSADDPLAEFEALARAERDAEKLDLGIAEDKVSVNAPAPQIAKLGEPSSRPRRLRGFLCDDPKKSQMSSQECVNQDVVDKLTELMELHRAKQSDEDRWRVFSYTKAIRALRNQPHRITSLEQARKLHGVGDKTANKIMEIVQTGQLRRIGYETTEDIAIVKVFTGIYGVGARTAHQWYAAGCRTLADITAGVGGVKLSDAQVIGMQFYEDINTRMPREEAKEIYEAIEKIALLIDAKLYVNIMGSYRRGKLTCGDIDILITRPTDDGLSHSGVLTKLLTSLHSSGILTEDLSIPSDPDALDAVYHGLCVRPLRDGETSHTKRIRRRIDFLTVPWESRGAALIYYTGDDIFNRSLRLKANKMGFSLNQKGLYAGVVRSPEDRTVKLSPGNIIASATEEEIFRILGVPWQEPHERVRG
ncbi:hypothetical protein FA95DRAFT_1550156 [Auriscalpium vulgare]|uniref:Uncharacterized protein n=1 Tax=Auriscalpium vulgare TaxID=40419 RepID=A0ACB8R830_9AGAM|nr:hypothetical protein FA95DRAFT_1550156 [Auriscalpium vulgare]